MNEKMNGGISTMRGIFCRLSFQKGGITAETIAAQGFDGGIFYVDTRQQRSHDESRDFFVGFRSFYSLHPSEISMLGVGKAAPAQFILRGKTNLRRISAAGQKAGFTAYPSHWASIWWDVIGG